MEPGSIKNKIAYISRLVTNLYVNHTFEHEKTNIAFRSLMQQFKAYLNERRTANGARIAERFNEVRNFSPQYYYFTIYIL
jgi:hypothetical protein